MKKQSKNILQRSKHYRLFKLYFWKIRKEMTEMYNWNRERGYW